MLSPAQQRPAQQRLGMIAPVALARNEQGLRFTAAMLLVCLLLQRFALPFGADSVSLVGPAGLAVIAWHLARGTLVFHPLRLIIFLGFLTCVVLGTAWRATGLGWTEGQASTNSLLQFVLLTSVATLSFARPVDETAFLRTVNLCLLLIAGCGLAQFAAQLAGLSLFSFAGLLPPAMLFEAGYHLEIPVGVGDLLKSNGFFLVEPSVFSQLMAVGLIIEVLAFRRTLCLAAFAAGLLLSFSGTGWIVIAAFVAMAPLRLGGRGVLLAAMVVVLFAAVAAGAFLLAPDLLDAFRSRLDEIATPGTSGHLRFITPFWLLGDVFRTDPSAALLGIGAGLSERLTMPYEYDVNTPVKIALEYGVPALLAYLALFLANRRTTLQAALVAPVMVLFLFTGGYQQFPPMIFLVLVLITIARLRV